MSGRLDVLPRWVSAPPTSLDGNYKPTLTGLIARQVSDISGRSSDLGGAVAEATWASLQPTQGGPIDTSGSSWTAIQAAKATGLPLRLRVFCGDRAPDWAKSLAGGPISMAHNETGVTLTVAKWWAPELQAAWADFMTKLAALLDSDPQIREVASHYATTEFAEPFNRSMSAPPISSGPNAGKLNMRVFYEAGLNGAVSNAAGTSPAGPDPVDTAAILWPTDIMPNGASRWYSFGWHTTRFYLPVNPVGQWWIIDRTAPAQSITATAGSNVWLQMHTGAPGDGTANITLSVSGRFSGTWSSNGLVTFARPRHTAAAVLTHVSAWSAATNGTLLATWTLPSGVQVRSGSYTDLEANVSGGSATMRVLMQFMIYDPGAWSNIAISKIANSMGAHVVLANNSLRVPLLQAGVKYPALYANEASEIVSPIGYQTATPSRLQAAYATVAPGATSAQALAATLDVGFGIVTSTNDPQNLVNPPATRLRARSIELPVPWSPLLSPSQCAVYNAAAAAN